jgi:hypothetical protein
MTERKATEKDEAYMNKGYAEGLTPPTIAKKMKANPELTSLSRRTVDRYLVAGVRERDDATKKKYHNTEKGALAQMWNNMKKRPWIKLEITKEQLDNAWKEQKKETGYACRLEGGTMDFKQTTNKERFYSNRISADRIDNTKGYTVENIWFVTMKKNIEKSGCTLRSMELSLEEKRKRNV